MKDALATWIQAQHQTLDAILARAAREYFQHHLNDAHFLFDVRQSEDETFNLSRGKDLCYDRPGIGFVYSMWYHARRVNTSLRLLLDALQEASGDDIDLYDLGAGTGAVQWAVGLIHAGMQKFGLKPPSIKVVNIDISAFMLSYLKHLWRHFVQAYPVCRSIPFECEVNSWMNSEKGYHQSWICSSYLFDHEDKKEDIGPDFVRMINKYEPARIFLSTSYQSNKVDFLESISSELGKHDYVETARVNHNHRLFFQGRLGEVAAFRNELNRKHQLQFNPNATSLEKSFIGIALARKQRGLFFKTPAAPSSFIEKINLFNPPIRVRRDIPLSEAQRKAAKPSGRPTIIYGPAGCGKSVVITERIKNVVEEAHYDPALRILLTTFNKGLIEQLGDWLESIPSLNADKMRRHRKTYFNGALDPTSDFVFAGSNVPNIRLMHFDVLPTRIGGLRRTDLKFEEYHRAKAAIAIEKTKERIKEKGLRPSDYAHVLNPDYVLTEYHRVYYGRWQHKGKYLTCARPGRPRLHKDGIPRQILWSCMKRYIRLCEQDHVDSIISRRFRFLSQLQSERHNDLFTHIFVDEFQDCTRADFAIFYQFLKDPNQLVVAGDLAQALHLGRSASVPRLSRAEQRNRDFRELEGSYRLPFRISECIVKLSERIQDKRQGLNDEVAISLQNPYKGSPPGARPIIVWAHSTQEMARKIETIYKVYECYDLDTVTILEKDNALCFALRQKRIDAETDTILRIKGLEKTCVVWSTRVAHDAEEETEEFIYTILTRTCSILIIALFDDMLPGYKPILNTLAQNRIIMWDHDTMHRYSVFCEDKELRDDYEEYSSEAEDELL